MNAPLVLQVPPLLRPMGCHWNSVPLLLALEQEDRVLCCNIPCFHKVRPLDLHLEVENFHLLGEFTLLLSELLLVSVLTHAGMLR